MATTVPGSSAESETLSDDLAGWAVSSSILRGPPDAFFTSGSGSDH